MNQQTVLDTDDFDIDTSNGKLVLQSNGSDKAWGASAGLGLGGGDAATPPVPNSLPVVSQAHQVDTVLQVFSFRLTNSLDPSFFFQTRVRGQAETCTVLLSQFVLFSAFVLSFG